VSKSESVFGGLFASRRVHQQLGISALSTKVEATSEAAASETKGEGVPATVDASETAKDVTSTKEE